MITPGRRVYGLGVIGLGLVQLIFGGFAPVWLPVSAHIPAYHPLAYASAGLLLLGGLAINSPRWAGIAALGLAAFFALCTLVLHLPHALAEPADWSGWQSIAESTVMALGAVLAYGQAPGVAGTRDTAGAGLARPVFGICLLVFGASHFVYARFTASLVPTWLPPSQLIWTWATGLAQIAAGLAMLSRVRARLAAILLTIMYAAFSLLVHIPSVIATPSSYDNWTENALNLTFVGAAWALADSLSRTGRGRRVSLTG